MNNHKTGDGAAAALRQIENTPDNKIHVLVETSESVGDAVFFDVLRGLYDWARSKRVFEIHIHVIRQVQPLRTEFDRVPYELTKPSLTAATDSVLVCHYPLNDLSVLTNCPSGLAELHLVLDKPDSDSYYTLPTLLAQFSHLQSLRLYLLHSPVQCLEPLLKVRNAIRCIDANPRSATPSIEIHRLRVDISSSIFSPMPLPATEIGEFNTRNGSAFTLTDRSSLGTVRLEAVKA